MPVFRLALVWALVDREIDEAFASTLNSPATRSCSAPMLFFLIRRAHIAKLAPRRTIATAFEDRETGSQRQTAKTALLTQPGHR
jgi:hypothetical protein